MSSIGEIISDLRHDARHNATIAGLFAGSLAVSGSLLGLSVENVIGISGQFIDVTAIVASAISAGGLVASAIDSINATSEANNLQSTYSAEALDYLITTEQSENPEV